MAASEKKIIFSFVCKKEYIKTEMYGKNVCHKNKSNIQKQNKVYLNFFHPFIYLFKEMEHGAWGTEAVNFWSERLASFKAFICYLCLCAQP